ncbi:MAG TPA: HEAT repeat domain-containing protein, partial [Magnetospirillaceae bacterium]|nr:HEAT repeat domain-containing protein [Magnetospirillaceae bacterium]
MKRLGYLLAMLASMAVAETWAAAPEPSGLDRRRDVVRYGIESELMELVTALQNEGQDELNTELLAVLTESRSPRLREAVLGFFTAREWPDAAREAAEILARRDLDSARVVNAALAYLSAVRAQEGLAEARKIVDARETQFLPQAIHMLGRTGGQADAEILLSMYASEEATDALRQDVIQALGELGSKAAVDSLLQALDDAEVRMATRVFAAEALGKIGDA